MCLQMVVRLCVCPGVLCPCLYVILLMERGLTQSLEMPRPHFQKNVIIPEIYNLDNIKLIQSCAYPESPPNKVAQLKKKNIQNIIRAIVNKPHPVRPHSRESSRPISARKGEFDQQSYRQIYSKQSEGGLLMQLDDQLGELLSLMDENLAPATDRIQAVLAKVASHLTVKQDMRKQQEVQQYLAACPKKPHKTNPEIPRPIRGMLDELEDLRKSGVRSGLRRRVQSAKTVGVRKGTEEFLERQSKSRLVQRGSTGNLKRGEGLSQQLVKSQQLITMINDCLGEEGKIRRGYQRKLGKMRGEWSEQGRLERTLLRSADMPLNAETLGILREKRLKQQGVARIDRQHFH